MNKNFTKILLAALLTVAAGCAGNSGTAGSTEAKPEETKEAEKKEKETATPETTEETTDDSELSFGEIGEGTYTNEYFGLKGEFSDDWAFATQEDLSSMNSMMPDILTNENAKKEMEEGTAVICFYAENGTAMQTVNIVVEKLPLSFYTVDQIVESNIEAVETQLAAQGLTDLKVEKGTVKFLGEDQVCLNISATMGEDTIHEVQTYVKNGNNMLAVTAVSYGDDTTSEVLDCFSKLK
jgi:hypothetical protein